MEPLPFFGYSLYQMFLLFCFWSFIGWGIEVCYMTLETGEYQNRGFLSMPICPIYGFGVLMIVTFFRPIENTFVLLFFASAALCTTFELMVGLGMEKLFHNKWWDYSHERFNFKGYICMKVSIMWGLGCVIVVRIVHPVVEKGVDMLPVKVGFGIIAVMSVLIAIDLVGSVSAVKRLNRRLKRMEEINNLLLAVSEKTGRKLAQGTIMVMENVDKVMAVKENAVDRVIAAKDNAVDRVIAVKDNIQDINAANREKLRAEYEKLFNERDLSVDRIVKAFPKMKSSSYSKSLTDLRNRIYGIKAELQEDEEVEEVIEEKKLSEENAVLK
ncbi:MAG: putative ABC transporter permease [Huintestinicola sp.]